LRYGFVTLPRDIGWSLLVGVVIAGMIAAVVPPGQLKPYLGGGLLSILLLIAAAVPVYVCATASVPIAAGLIHLGASPGAALAFLIAGPATNAATFTTIWKVLGRRTAVIYLAVVALSAVLSGLALDGLMPSMREAIPQLGSHVHESPGAVWTTHVWAVLLLGVLAFSSGAAARLRPGRRGGGARAQSPPPDDRKQLVLAVSGMTCSHCADAVERALSECEGVDAAEVDLGRAWAVVTGRGFDRPRLVSAVTGLGYAVNVVELTDAPPARPGGNGCTKPAGAPDHDHAERRDG
jgi:copper chaperone CopZ